MPACFAASCFKSFPMQCVFRRLPDLVSCSGDESLFSHFSRCHFPVTLSLVIARLSSSLAAMELSDLRGVRLGVVRFLCSCSFFLLVVCFVAFLVCVALLLRAGLFGFLSSFFVESFRP
ncbi:unnamed protein product [Polarella glacialis]|uniref:Transmembrane protein n=1 Tax=Polarella glacialis TaxID=89957 RepID=A0A813E3E5_POLGL|nr:unnamed protein product [Polarella glacialis]